MNPLSLDEVIMWRIVGLLISDSCELWMKSRMTFEPSVAAVRVCGRGLIYSPRLFGEQYVSQ